MRSRGRAAVPKRLVDLRSQVPLLDIASYRKGAPVVALRFTPVVMNGSNERFSVVHGKRIHLRPVRVTKTRTSKVECRVFMERPVAIAEVKGALQDTDRLVVSLLTPVRRVCDSDQARVTD